MSTSKIKIQYGNVSFEAEGDPAWVVEQVEKFNARVDTRKAAPQSAAFSPLGGELPSNGFTANAPIGNLSSFLIAKSATTNQNRKFLATAEWLTQKGKAVLTTGDITKALNDYKQSRLGNATECLNRNIGKGFCEKTEGGFFVTPEGRSAIGTAEPTGTPSGNEPDQQTTGSTPPEST
jgi:hypothetical protein